MKNLLLAAAVLVVAACDRAESPEAGAAQKQQLEAARSTCVQLFQRQRACTSDYIPALVDLRRELDVPAGISKEPRPQLVAAAMEEWKSDSTDDAISTQCDRLAGSMPAPAVAEAQRCAGLTACGEVVQCVMPIMRQHLSR